MQVNVVFDNSGDTIAFEAINPDVVEYYVDSLNQKNLNKFSEISPKSLLNSVANLQNSINKVNDFIYDLTGEKLGPYTDDELLNQRVLNGIHEKWVKSQSKIFDVRHSLNSKNSKTAQYAETIFHQCNDDDMLMPLGTVLVKLGFARAYSEINLTVHNVENEFRIRRFSTERWIEFPNICDKSLVTNDKYNLSLPFNHLGRTLHNKFIFYDSNLEFDDENSFDQLLGFVNINLQKKETVGYSQEYLNWCATHNRAPIGNNLNVGFLPNIEDKLLDYRLIIYRNNISNNSFRLYIQ